MACRRSSALAAPVFLGGVRAVARVAEWLAPLMAAGYVLLALVIVVLHADRVPEVLMLILRSAFGLEPAVAGATGGMLAAMLNGVRRGLFSNEAGMGSAPNAAATATVAHPVQQGFVQSVAVFLFAFSSILGNYAYAECNATFLSSRRVVLRVFRVLAIGAVLGGSLAELPLVWTLADITMGLMALVNLVAILLLGRWAFGALADWEAAARHGTPEFRPAENPHLPAALPTRAW
jgi:AGCS family alanine or glycine:cation symporter